MTEPAHGEPIRPELRAIVMHVDLTDSSYRVLAEFASRIATPRFADATRALSQLSRRSHVLPDWG
jgi:hypothetical protein